MSQQKKFKKVRGNIPIYERTEISKSVLLAYPQYKELFHKCGGCGKYSLKPLGYKKMTVTEIANNASRLERKCWLCGFVQKPLGVF